MDSSAAHLLRTAARPVFDASPVSFAYLFGSAATGRTHARSDVDVAVHLPEARIADSLEVSLDLAGRLVEATRLPVEVLVLNGTPLPLRGRVVRDRIVVYSRNEEARVAFESRTLDDFLDFDIHARRLDRALLERMAPRKPLMVDPGRLRALLDRIGEETRHLERLASLPGERLLADPDLLAAVKYRFVIAIEACIDAGEHVIASEGLPAPADFASVFAVLAEGGFLPADAAAPLQSMARFRNLLVHGYARVDDDRVVSILRSGPADLRRFVAQLAGSTFGPGR